MTFKAPYFSDSDIRRRADEFLKDHNRQRRIPVPIETIVEVSYRIDIVPMPGLQKAFDVVAFISKDLSEIRVDDFVFANRPNRYRFSLAHELGHRVLHADVWEQLTFDDIATWKNFVTDAIPEREYSFLEYHANTFAGLVLVPPNELIEMFRTCIEMAKSAQLDVADESTGVREYVEAHLGRKFEVSEDVIHRRIEKDGLWNTIR